MYYVFVLLLFFVSICRLIFINFTTEVSLGSSNSRLHFGSDLTQVKQLFYR